MRHRCLLICLLVSATVAGLPEAGAQVRGESPAPDVVFSGSYERIDPRFGFLRDTIRRFGDHAAVFGPGGAPPGVTEDTATALLRFTRRLTVAELGWLEDHGIRIRRRDGRPVRVGSVYAARVRYDALETLREHPLLLRADAGWTPIQVRPLEVTSELVGAAQARRHPDLGADGSGGLIANLDSAVDILHPHFFRADGGYFRWLDVDEDGVFEPGLDRVDYDGDGEADPKERLRLLDATAVNFASRQRSNADGNFQPSRDWLYADLNQDEERNAGAAAGFTESDPGYGEPLFVADDVDGDGVLAPDEKLVLLDTSKIVRFVTPSRTYMRGVDLIEAADDPAMDNAFHGTGVASILVGGQPPFHDRVGLAPGAELLAYLAWDVNEMSDRPTFDHTVQLEAIADALQSDADVIVHEWTEPVGVPQDGSTNLEAAMDGARAEGLLQVTPVGNLNRSRKHLEAEAKAGMPLELEFDVDTGFDRGGETVMFTAAYASLFWSTGQTPTFELVAPDGTTAVIDPTADASAIGADTYQGLLDVSTRGTRHLLLYLWNEADASLQQGTWKIRITGIEEDDTIFARVTDHHSNWAPGITWVNPTNDRGTIVFPSTADSAFGVAAYGGRHDATKWDDSEAGELRNFSGRGPRMDGAPVVDLAGPDDPYAAMAATPPLLAAGYGRTWFATFGGTSGAGPHVAAALTLLRLANPDWTADELEARLIATADTDDLAPDFGALPNRHWGHGRVDLYRALSGDSPPDDNAPPRAALRVDLERNTLLDASDSVDPDGDTLSYRFDVDYDGVWDTEWQDTPTAVVPSELLGDEHLVARVDVRDELGARSGAVARYFEDEGESPDMGVSDGGDAGRPDPADAGSGGGSNGEDCLFCAVGQPGGESSLLLLLLCISGLALRRTRNPSNSGE